MPSAQRLEHSPPVWRSQRGWALALAVVVGMGLIALLGVARDIQATAAGSPHCRPDGRTPEPLALLEGQAASILTLELAGHTRQVIAQLRWRTGQPASLDRAPGLAEQACIGARIRTRWDELTRLDAAVLIPLYVSVSLLFAAWLFCIRRPAVDRVSGFLALAVLLCTVGLAVLDGRENRAALALLVAADMPGALDPSRWPSLDALAASAREASLHKWWVAGLWLAVLAWAMGRAATGVRRLALRWLWWLAVAAAVVGAALLLATSVAAAWGGLGLGLAVQGLSLGFILALATLLLMVAAVLLTSAFSPCGAAQAPIQQAHGV